MPMTRCLSKSEQKPRAAVPDFVFSPPELVERKVIRLPTGSRNKLCLNPALAAPQSKIPIWPPNVVAVLDPAKQPEWTEVSSDGVVNLGRFGHLKRMS